MKVGLLTFFWPTGDPDSGIARNFHRLAGALVKRGHAVTVFHLNPRKVFWSRLRSSWDEGFEVIEIPCWVIPHRDWTAGQPATHLAALIRLAFIFGRRGRHLDVMETTSFGGFARILSTLAWWKLPPLLVRISTTGEQLNGFSRKERLVFYDVDRMESDLIRCAPHPCTHTEAHRDLICTRFNLDPARMEVIPHGIDLPDLSVLRPAREKTVLYAGRFEGRKGTDSLLQAIPLVLDRLPDCRFDLVGEGTMYKIWREAFLRKHGDLAGHVRFLGRVPDEKLEELYQNCDFFVAPALYESFGMVYLEAMRYGKPVIGCLNSGGAAEVIGVGGLLVPQGDAEQLAVAIIRLWTDRKLHQELSVRARLRAEYYSMDRKAERTEKVYSRLIATE